ncbi:MAG: hypothetical protein HY288_19875 [Planctomycetia bacterium]|nr:hypothetical protein [Planctomycetia bacterium]
MIAPVREPPARPTGSANRLAAARRVVAAALLNRSARRNSGTPRVSNLLAWTFVAWAAAVAISYVALGGRWIIPLY